MTPSVNRVASWYHARMQTEVKMSALWKFRGQKQSAAAVGVVLELQVEVTFFQMLKRLCGDKTAKIDKKWSMPVIVLFYFVLFAFWSRHELPCMAGCVRSRACVCAPARPSVFVCDVVWVWTLSAARTPRLRATGKCGRHVCQASYTWLVYMHYSHTYTHSQTHTCVHSQEHAHRHTLTKITAVTETHAEGG